MMKKWLRSALTLVAAFMAVAFMAPAAHADDSPTAKLPAAMTDMMLAAYKCQALTGVELYTEVKSTVESLTLKLSGDDKELTTQYIAAIEGAAKVQCPDPSTCWRDFLGLSASATAAQGTPLCEKKISDSMTVVSDLLDILLKAQG